jgi:hypothetical protein
MGERKLRSSLADLVRMAAKLRPASGNSFGVTTDRQPASTSDLPNCPEPLAVVLGFEPCLRSLQFVYIDGLGRRAISILGLVLHM